MPFFRTIVTISHFRPRLLLIQNCRLRIRGYDIVRAEQKSIEFAEAGVFTVNESQ